MDKDDAKVRQAAIAVVDALLSNWRGDKFGFSERLVNQCIEYAMRAYGVSLRKRPACTPMTTSSANRLISVAGSEAACLLQ